MTFFGCLKDKLYQKNWNVYSKSLLSGPDRVIEYLGRYTHRVAISNSRIMGMKNDQITFKIKIISLTITPQP